MTQGLDIPAPLPRMAIGTFREIKLPLGCCGPPMWPSVHNNSPENIFLCLIQASNILILRPPGNLPYGLLCGDLPPLLSSHRYSDGCQYVGFVDEFLNLLEFTGMGLIMFGASDNGIGTSDQRHWNFGYNPFLLVCASGSPRFVGDPLTCMGGDAYGLACRT